MAELYDVEHDCEGNTFIATNLTRAEADARRLALADDDTVSNVRVVPAPPART